MGGFHPSAGTFFDSGPAGLTFFTFLLFDTLFTVFVCFLKNLRKPQENKAFLEIEISLLSCRISKMTMFWKNCIHFFLISGWAR